MGREITKCTVMYGVYIWFWPTLYIHGVHIWPALVIKTYSYEQTHTYNEV